MRDRGGQTRTDGRRRRPSAADAAEAAAVEAAEAAVAEAAEATHMYSAVWRCQEQSRVHYGRQGQMINVIRGRPTTSRSAVTSRSRDWRRAYFGVLE